MKQKNIEQDKWFDLSEAAEFLGVHFTTLRRWADAGEIAYLRTPGGRRRFSLSALAAFLEKSQHGDTHSLTIIEPLQERAIETTRAGIRSMSGSGMGLDRIDGEQRARMRGTGHRLMALLLQYNTRAEGGEVFLEEGRRIMREYSQICSLNNLSLQETVRILMFFRRSILDAVYETGYLSEGADRDRIQLFDRTTEYLDELIIELVGSYPVPNTP
jgi:excisionase family DNA binding protein